MFNLDGHQFYGLKKKFGEGRNPLEKNYEWKKRNGTGISKE